MRRSALLLLALALALGLAAPAGAAPMVWNANLTLGMAIQGIAPITISSPGTVSVDLPGQTLSVGAGAVVYATPIVVPVTSTSAIQSVTIPSIQNLTGSFFLGGGAVPGESCPPGLREACVAGTGIGGQMGIDATVNVHVIPNVVVVPLVIDAVGVGIGGSTSIPFSVDAAPWTTRTASLVLQSGTLVSTVGSALTPGGVSFVTPTYIEAFGFEVPTILFFSVELLSVPEPAPMLLLAAGAAGWAVSGWRSDTGRRRRRGSEGRRSGPADR